MVRDKHRLRCVRRQAHRRHSGRFYRNLTMDGRDLPNRRHLTNSSVHPITDAADRVLPPHFTRDHIQIGVLIVPVVGAYISQRAIEGFCRNTSEGREEGAVELGFDTRMEG